MNEGFPVSKFVIIQSAQNAIDSIENTRKKAFDAEVDKALKSWFFRPKTRELAEIRVKSLSPTTAKWRIAAWGTLYDAKELLAATKVMSGNTAYLTAEQAAFINAWIERKPG